MSLRKFFFWIVTAGLAPAVNGQVSLNMSMLGNWDNNSLPVYNGVVYNDCWGYAAGGREYAIVGSAQRIHFFDITDPADIVQVNSFAGGANSIWRDMKTYGHYAYSVADQGSEGLMIFNLSNLPTSVSKSAQLTTWFTKSHNIFVDEANGRLYVVGINHPMGYDMIVLNIANNPANPSLIAYVNLPGGYIHDVYVRDNIAYCSHGYNGLYIYDLTNPSSPVTLKSITSYPDQGYNHSSWLTDDGHYMVFADEVPTGLGVKMADITSDPSEIIVTDVFRSQLLAPAQTNSVPHNPFIIGNLVYVSYYEDGVQIFDISNPYDVQRVGYYDTYTAHTTYGSYDGAWGVYPFLPSGHIIVSDILNGLFVVQYNGLLPVEWGDFKAVAEGSKIRLDWQVFLEKNSEGFVVERSADGREFDPIGSVGSKGDSEQGHAYATYDNDPLNGWNYYRLAQKDYDGKITYSKIATAFMRGGNAADWQVYPTVVTFGNPLNVTGIAGRPLRMEWIDGQGRTLNRWAFEPGAHRETIWPDLRTAGIFMLRIWDGDRIVATQRVAVGG